MPTRGELFLERARVAAEEAASAEAMGYPDIARAFRDIEKAWMELANETEPKKMSRSGA